MMNNFSKAVMDLISRTANENAAAVKAQDDAAETEFDQDNKVETVTAGSAVPLREEAPSTVISRSMAIVGEITSCDALDIYGDVRGSVRTEGDIKATGKIIGDMEGNSFALNGCTIQGNITAKGKISIGTNTFIVGDITADSITLNGKVKGNLKIAGMSEFLESAMLIGDVHSQTISMSQGAKLLGSISVALDSAQSEKELDSIFGL